ncbi:MAG TPA: hypothetical protein VFZ03_06590 [Dongiaceae bacterium]
MTERTKARLPIRLLPRRRGQIVPIIFFGFFLAFAIFWTAMATSMIGKADFVDPGKPEFWLGKLFPLFGVPFMLIGAGGIARAILKMLPDSPYHHLEINSEGLLVRSPFKRRRFAWRELPPFDTLERRRRTKNGVRSDWYTVAMESLPPKPGMKQGDSYQHEVLRLFADEYGANNGQQDAADLAAWLNQLRELGAGKRLAPAEEVELPEGFRANVRSTGLSQPGMRSTQHAPTVVRR